MELHLQLLVGRLSYSHMLQQQPCLQAKAPRARCPRECPTLPKVPRPVQYTQRRRAPSAQAKNIYG